MRVACQWNHLGAHPGITALYGWVITLFRFGNLSAWAEGRSSDASPPSLALNEVENSRRGITIIKYSQNPSRAALRRLLLAEKFSAALRLAKILSEGTAKKVRGEGVSHFTFSSGPDEVIVLPLRGHVVEIDYPDAYQDWKRVDLHALVDLTPIRLESRPAVHEALRRLAPTVDEVVLATDYDREGELIGIEALETLRAVRPDLPARRACFSAMTAPEIRRAFASVKEPDWNLARAAGARQQIDLAWGAVLTRFLTVRCGLDGRLLSAGRVQTPTLALVAEREREREGFVPRPFWNVVVRLGEPPFEARAEGGPFWDRSGAESTMALASFASDAVVEKVDRREEREAPPSPFNTTSFLADASRRGVSAPRAMALAQRLYLRGEISYPRTDNTVYPSSLNIRGILESLRETKYRDPVEHLLAQPELVPSRGPVRATDHPPIHPTASPSKPHGGPEGIVYDRIVRRFLATLSPPAIRTVTRVELCVGDVRFRAEGYRTEDPGWVSIYDQHEDGESDLPPVEAGEALSVLGAHIAEDRTRPPTLHTQASLLHGMERLGLGTKATRHEILDLLLRRHYLEGRSLRTTTEGRALVDALALHASEVTSSEMTRRLEERMDAIAEGRATLDGVVSESRQALHGVLTGLLNHEASLARWLREAAYLEKDFGPCDACGRGRMVRRRTKNGWSFLGCTEFPQCRHRLRLTRGGDLVPWKPREDVSLATS